MKKYLMIAKMYLLLAFFVTNVQAQSTITHINKGSMGARKGFNLSCVYKNYLYHSDCFDNDSLYRLDLNTGFDTPVCKLPFSSYLPISPAWGPNYLLPASILIGTDLYILNNDNTFRKFNIITSTWSNLSAHTSSFFWGKKGVTSDGVNYIYVWGGRANNCPGNTICSNDLEHSDELWRYSISTNTWYLLSKAPVRLLCQDAVYNYPYIYFGSGGQWAGGVNSNNVYQFNLLTNVWSNFSSPFSGKDYYCVNSNYFNYKGQLYAFGYLRDMNSGACQTKLCSRDIINQTWVDDTVTSTQEISFLKNQVSEQRNGYMHYKAFPLTDKMIFCNDFCHTGNNFVVSGYKYVFTLSPKRIVFIDIDSSDCYNGEDSFVVYTKLFLNGTFVNNTLTLKLISPNGVASSLETINNLYSSTAQTLYRKFKFDKKYLNHRLYCESITGNDTSKSFNTLVLNSGLRNSSLDTLFATSNTSFCVGQPVGAQLYLKNKPSRKYTWFYNNNQLQNQNGLSYTATSIGAYKVKVVNSVTGCSSLTNIIDLKYFPTATVKFDGNAKFCDGDTAKLSTEYNSGYTYQWKKNGADIPGANSFKYYTVNSGNYSVFVKFNNNCSSLSNAANVFFNSKQSVNVSTLGSQKLCKGQQLFLKADTGKDLQWYKDGNPIQNATGKQLVVVDSGIYKVKLVNDSGCVNYSNEIIVKYVPFVAAIEPFDDTICQDNSILFKIKNLINNDSIRTVDWFVNDGTHNSNNNYVKNFYQSGNFSVKLKLVSVSGCVDSTQQKIVVNKKTNAGIIVGQNSGLKLNQAYSYIVSQQNSAKYEWIVTNGVILSGQGTNSVSIQWASNGSGKIELVLENITGCTDSAKLSVLIGVAPNITFFNPIQGFNDDTIVIVGNNFLGVDSVYFGKTNAKSFEVINSSVIKAVVDTGSTGSVRVITVNGNCSKAGFIYGNKVGTDDINLVLGFKFYPNPAFDVLNIETQSNCRVKIMNAIGQSIYNQVLIESIEQIDISHWQRGVYFIQLTNNDMQHIATYKLIIE